MAEFLQNYFFSKIDIHLTTTRIRNSLEPFLNIYILCFFVDPNLGSPGDGFNQPNPPGKRRKKSRVRCLSDLGQNILTVTITITRPLDKSA